MKNRIFTVVFLLVLLVTLTSNAQAITPNTVQHNSLVYVVIDTSDDISRFATTHLPLYSTLEGGLLTGIDQVGQRSLSDAGLSYQVLDSDLTKGNYYLASYRPSHSARDFSVYGKVLLNLSTAVLLRMDPAQVDALTQAGADIKAITLTPKPLPPAQSEAGFTEVVEPDPLIQGMIDQVTVTQVYTYDKQLAGELPVWVDGDWYTIPSRYTYSGTPIQKTTHFVYQHMQDLGLDVNYHQWGGNTYPNVIGEIPGQTNPDDIFIIGAHIDDVQGAPGADDNASGSVATLLAADILSQYQWGCTLRFAFWTGEEQGLLGSYAYAQQAYQSGENILGYLNLDMIAWNTIGSDPYINLIYSTSLPPTQELAQLFADVIDTYDLSLLIRFGQNMWGSDHNSFWDFGFTSILAIEDDLGNDFNPYYHSPYDTPLHTDPFYFTNFVKSSIATYAHMTGCLIPPDNGFLNGHVTSSANGIPLQGAVVSAEDDLGHAYPSTTDINGYYTMTIPVNTYTVTATADGYEPGEISGISIITDTITTQDFDLQPACQPVSDLDFTWSPLEPFNGDLITFTATATGTPPIDFLWDFGDTYTGTGETAMHSYTIANHYTVGLTATNACDPQFTSHEVTVSQRLLEIFLPLLNH